MRKNLLKTTLAVLSLSLLGSLAGCSEITIFTTESGNGSGGGTQPEGNAALVSFHASIEGRRMSRAISPISSDIRAQVYVFNSTDGNAAGNPVANGLYESVVPGTLLGVSGYKMYLVNGVYNFYSVSENAAFSSMRFTDGVSDPLFNGIDYLWWMDTQQEVSSSQISVPIVFGHSATQVVFEVVAGPGVTLNQLVFAHINPTKPDAQMNLTTGVIPPATAYQNNSTNDKMGINGFLAQYIMLPLETTDPMEVSFDVLINGESNTREYKVDVPVPNGKLVAGESYRFKAVIQGSGVELPEVSIKDWLDVDETGKPLYPNQ